jgi:hypothetical protein
MTSLGRSACTLREHAGRAHAHHADHVPWPLLPLPASPRRARDDPWTPSPRQDHGHARKHSTPTADAPRARRFCRAQASAFLLPSGLASPPDTLGTMPARGCPITAHGRPGAHTPNTEAPSCLCSISPSLHSTPRPRFRQLERPNQGAAAGLFTDGSALGFSIEHLVRALTPLLPSTLERGDAANRRTACTSTITADTANQCDAVAKRA